MAIEIRVIGVSVVAGELAARPEGSSGDVVGVDADESSLAWGSSGWCRGSVVGQLTTAMGVECPRSASEVATSSIRAASQRSVGVPAEVGEEHSGVGRLIHIALIAGEGRGGFHSTPMIQPASQLETSSSQVPEARPGLPGKVRSP